MSLVAASLTQSGHKRLVYLKEIAAGNVMDGAGRSLFNDPEPIHERGLMHSSCSSTAPSSLGYDPV